MTRLQRRLKITLARSGRHVLRHPLAVMLVVLPAALSAGSLAGYALAGAGGDKSYRATRLQSIEAQLARLDGDYVLAAGDSHIERWPSRMFCGLPVVNAGVSGATAASYGEILDSFTLPRTPRAIILTIGSNDANTRRFHDPAEAARRFEAGFRSLIVGLIGKTDLVVMTGAPPLDRARATGFSSDAAARIDAIARPICRTERACLVAPSFPTGLAMTDGVHFDDYALAYRHLEPSLCAGLKLGRSSVVHDVGKDAAGLLTNPP